MSMVYIGIDIGSSCAKTAVMSQEKKLLYTDLLPTGWNSLETAQTIREKLEAEGFSPEENPVVATGYGRVSVPYAAKTLTEISCHGAGAAWLFQTDKGMVIDIGGQDSKIILLEDGLVKDFVMNDKCSAGTGRFLEVMASAMGMSPAGLVELAREGKGVAISSMCTVFAESEVISLIGQGTAKADIAFGILDSIVNKIRSQCGKAFSSQGAVYLTGGLCDCPFLLESLGKKLDAEVVSHPQARFAGAIGAAIFARKIR